jgi:hypothetical protein
LIIPYVVILLNMWYNYLIENKRRKVCLSS